MSKLKELIAFANELGIEQPSEINPKHTIVMIEGHKEMGGILKFQLESVGFRNVVCFHKGVEAVKSLKLIDDPVSIVICADELPDMDGYTFFEETLNILEIPQAPFIMSMASATQDRVMFAIEKGIDKVLGKPFSSKDLFKKLTEAFQHYHGSGNIEKIYAHVQELVVQNDYKKALQILEKFAGIVGDSPRLLKEMAWICFKLGDIQKANNLLAKAIKINPKYVHAYALRGEMLAHQAQYADAIVEFMTSINLSPLNPVRYEQVCFLLTKLKRPREVIKIIKKALEHGVETNDLLHMISQSSMMVRNYDDAARYIRMALRSDPNNIDYLNQLGICFRSAGRFSDAMETYNQIIKHDPENALAFYNKAILYKAQGDLEKCVATLRKTCKRFTDFVPAHEKLMELQPHVKPETTQLDDSDLI